MRKTKLLLVAFLAMLGMSSYAQSWTPAEVAEGEFYLYNVGKGLYFGKGNAWGTQASMTELTDGNTILAKLVKVGDYFFINTKVGNDAWGLENLAAAGDVYTDQSRGKQSTWEFQKAGDGNVYYIISKDNHGGGSGRYLTASADDTILRDANESTSDYAKWKLLSPSDKDAAIQEASLKAVREHYNAVKNAVLAIKSDLDISEAESLANAATSEEGFNNAISSVRNALNNYLPTTNDVVNITSALIDNAAPGISGNMNYWTNSGNPGLQNQLWEYWNQKGKTSQQTIANLAPGYYLLKVIAYTREGMNGKIYAGENTKTLVGVASSVVNDRGQGNTWIAAGNGVNNLIFNVSSSASNISIGIEASSDEEGDGWTCWRSFELTYAKDLSTLYKVPLKEVVDNAALIEEGSIPASAYAAFQEVLNDNNKTWDTAEDYEKAIQAIKDATENAKALVDPYANYLDKVEAVKNMKDEDVYTGSDAKETLEGVISETEQNVNAATTAEAIDAETAKLVPAAKAFVKDVTINPDACLDITCLIENPHFIYGKGGGNVATGWTLAAGGSITEHRLSTHNFEAWHRKFDLSQTITELPMGTYKVTLQGFARHDDTNVTDKTFLYCGVKTVSVKDITAEWSTTSYYKPGDPQMGDGNYDSSYQKDGVTVYQPNGMTGAYYWFQKTNPETSLPFYTSEVETLLAEDGDLKIGFKCEADQDWVLWDNFHLYYYGSAIAVTLDEAEGSAYSEDIENANVTLKKTISEGWNTVILPIAATKSEIGATELYTYSGNEDGKLLFTSADEIEPNVPYLMKASAAITEPMTFNGVTVKAAAESLVTEGDNFNFVGTYTGTTALEGDYVLTENAFTKANGGNTIKAYRAYIKTVADAAEEEASARELLISIDGVLTAIDAIDGKKISTGAIYNLAGQKVKKAQKGIFIQDGKKVIVK